MAILLLAGATGLVGQAVLRQALADSRVARLVALTRRPLPAHPKLESPIVDFDALPVDAPWWPVDGVICALGTTIRRAGSRQAFRKVDFEYPLAIARLARSHGAKAFALTSSMGADPHSKLFYLRTKGELERELAACGFPSLTVARPSILEGYREQSRPLESLGLRLFRIFGPLAPRRYRIVPAERVAKALLEAAIAAPEGIRIIESDAL